MLHAHRIFSIKSICIDIYIEIIVHDYIIRLGNWYTSRQIIECKDNWNAYIRCLSVCRSVGSSVGMIDSALAVAFKIGAYFGCLLWWPATSTEMHTWCAIVKSTIFLNDGYTRFLNANPTKYSFAQSLQRARARALAHTIIHSHT